MSSVDTSNLQALGENSKVAASLFNGPHKHLLEYFNSPLRNTPDSSFVGMVKITCPEFTSLCPKTGQPDFATIVIEYMPRERCVESKSLKLYLCSYRNAGEFHEACIQRMADDLVALLEPRMLVVRGEFTPRGGIPFWPTVTYIAPDQDMTVTSMQTLSA